ncbi:MAG: glycerophosphodiester phosphodiesterase [Oscillospiraceae bacterium]|nr:glycerophosphodiester phosphodiesterase [Oscillospiraceae bacterium]
MTLIFIFAGVIVFLTVAVTFCVAPGKLSQESKKTSRIFYGLNCAHRGLHTNDQLIPENSLLAFNAAKNAGYGIELDVQLSKDGKVIVFHDDDLNRVCGIDAPVNSKTWEELSVIPLFNTKECIPLLSDILPAMNDTPLIVELKSAGANNSKLCSETLIILREQGQNWCIESFDPRIVAWFMKNAPDVLRGQLSRPPKNMEGISKVTAFLLGNLFTNFMSRPHFIAYENTPHPLTVKLCRAMKPLNFVWTLKPEHNTKKYENLNDATIFEYYTPEPRYK